MHDTFITTIMNKSNNIIGIPINNMPQILFSFPQILIELEYFRN